MREPTGLTLGARVPGTRLIALRWEKVQLPTQRRTLLWCQCDCGTVFRTYPEAVKRRLTTSCGCWREEVRRACRGERHWRRQRARAQEGT